MNLNINLNPTVSVSGAGYLSAGQSPGRLSGSRVPAHKNAQANPPRINPERTNPGSSRAKTREPGDAAPVSRQKMLWSGLKPLKYVKRAGHSLRHEKNGDWDTFAVARFVDLLGKATGSTMDPHTILRRYDLNGDGVLSREEQSAMIEDLTAAANQNESLASAGILNEALQNTRQAFAVREQNYREQRLRRYEHFFWYEDIPASGFGA
ncbi:MAG: hypothetical protein LBT44_01245 [Clostridiales bacterium]|jgi:hypothetical protein|nr:hypothetical protein [Clostridiales bacterium]